MPYRDRTGPMGRGQLTGRGMGPCGGGMRRGRGFWCRRLPIKKEDERKFLKEELEAIEEDKKLIAKRLKELEK